MSRDQEKCICFSRLGDSGSDTSEEPWALSTGKARINRIMKRDMPMRQSWGHFDIERHGVSKRLLLSNGFHVLLQLPTWQLLCISACVYMLAWLAFAVWWYHIAVPCGISLGTYQQALYLSIETMMTIGYGVDDPFFRDCSEALPLLFCQTFSGLLLDIAIIGIVFQRFSRAYLRAATIIFSKTLLLRVRGDTVQIAFRIAEMQDAPLLQVVLQAYCVVHRVDLSAASASEELDIEDVAMKALHLQELDTNNNVLLCGLPMTVTHTIDQDSPLAPCNRYRHTGTHDPSLLEVEAHLKNLPYVEILVILSGVEEITGASVEGRQSYTLQEIESGREFARCVSLDSTGSHCIDFELFHDTFALQHRIVGTPSSSGTSLGSISG